MSTKVVLPSFTVSGRGPHPAIRVLWASGVLLVIATLVLGGAVWYRQTADAAMTAAAARAAATAVAQQPSVVVAPAVRPPALAAAPPPAPTAEAAPSLSVAPAPVAEVAPAPSRHRHHHHLRGVRYSTRGKAVAVRGPGETRASRKSSARNDDTVDRLLKQFK